MKYSDTHCFECNERRIVDSKTCLNCGAEFDRERDRDE